MDNHETPTKRRLDSGMTSTRSERCCPMSGYWPAGRVRHQLLSFTDTLSSTSNRQLNMKTVQCPRPVRKQNVH